MRMGIKTKIIIYTSLVVSVALIAGGGFAYYYFSSVLKMQTVNGDRFKLQQTSEQLKYAMNDIRKCSYNIITDQDIQNFLTDARSNRDTEKVFYDRKIFTRLQWLTNLNGSIISSAILKTNGDVYWNKFLYDDYFKNTLAEAWYADFEKSRMSSGFTGVHYTITEGNPKEPVISYITQILSVQDPNKKIGRLILNVNTDYFFSILEKGASEFDEYLLTDGNGSIIYSKNKEMRFSGFADTVNDKSGKYENADYYDSPGGYVYFCRSLDSGWVLAAFNSKDRVYERTRHIFYFFLLFIIIGIVIVILTVMPLITSVTRPITMLTGAMKQVSKGNLEVALKICSKDEMELLGDGFNKMLEDLKHLLQSSVENERIKKDMEYELLLHQINPHFIYNTLNTVIYLARKYKNHDIEEMTGSFIRILQDTVDMDKQGLFSSIGKEMEIVGHYAVIQKYRYGDRFTLKWSIDESMTVKIIPKSILQSLVENSLYHGISPMEGKGEILVSAFEENGRITIVVEDNGIGMDEETINKVLAGEDIRKSKARIRSIGLKNINERIRYLFGREAGINIESALNGGTKVTVYFPDINI